MLHQLQLGNGIPALFLQHLMKWGSGSYPCWAFPVDDLFWKMEADCETSLKRYRPTNRNVSEFLDLGFHNRFSTNRTPFWHFREPVTLSLSRDVVSKFMQTNCSGVSRYHKKGSTWNITSARKKKKLCQKNKETLKETNLEIVAGCSEQIWFPPSYQLSKHFYHFQTIKKFILKNAVDEAY